MSGFPIGLVSTILPISSQALEKMLWMNAGIEVCRLVPAGFSIKSKNFDSLSDISIRIDST